MRPNDVILRLEQAGATYLSLPMAYRRAVSLGTVPCVRLPGVQPTEVPAGADITGMREAFGWLNLIQRERKVLRNIVAMRALWRPDNGQPVFPWADMARALGVHASTVRRWHGEGIELICAGLAQREAA